MFSFLSRKPKLKITDKVFQTESAKLKALSDQLYIEEDTVFIAWFEADYYKLKEYASSQYMKAIILMAEEANLSNTNKKQVIFISHYPVLEKENELFNKLLLKNTVFYSSLDEPLFTRTYGNKIAVLSKKLRIKEGEALDHPLISASIRKIQKKISSKVIWEKPASSQEAWITRNLAE